MNSYLYFSDSLYTASTFQDYLASLSVDIVYKKLWADVNN